MKQLADRPRFLEQRLAIDGGHRGLRNKDSDPNGTYLSQNHRHPGAGRDPVATLGGFAPWIIRFAHPAGRPVGVQRATRFCPACAGMTRRPNLLVICLK